MYNSKAMDLTKKQQYELLASISARGEIPTKYIYLVDNGELMWDQVYMSRSGNGMSGIEMRLLLAHLYSFISVFSNSRGVNLIDLGCGNGLPVIPIVQELKKHQLSVTYTGVDISAEMLDLAEKNIKKDFSALKVNKLKRDFEKESLTNDLLDIKQTNNYSNLLINLGNTLGNYVNASAVLTNFLESMTTDDYLLVGNGLSNEYNPQRILAAYNSELIHEFAVGPAKSLGLYDQNDDFRFIWNPDKTRVEGRIRLSQERTITLAEQHLYLGADEEILVVRSDKFTETSLTKLLSDVGFRTEMLTTTKDRSHILTMVQPTRYSVA